MAQHPKVPMKRHLRLHIPVLALGVIVFSPASGWSGSVKIIANASVRTDYISKPEIVSVFLQEKRSLSDGTPVEPVLERSGPAHAAFLKDFLRQSDASLQRFYQSLVFTGRGSMPKSLASDAEVVAYVARTHGAIGYVAADTVVAGVKTLIVDSGRTDVERKLIAHIEPIYPEELQKRLIGGTVRLKVTISSSGDVQEVSLIGGNPILGAAAMAAVQRWKYAVATSPTVTQISIQFNPQQ